MFNGTLGINDFQPNPLYMQHMKREGKNEKKKQIKIITHDRCHQLNLLLEQGNTIKHTDLCEK